MKQFITLATLAILAAFSVCVSAQQNTGPASPRMETYSKPGSAISYHRVVVAATTPVLEAPVPSVAEVKTASAVVALEKYTKPGSAIVYHRPVGSIGSSAE
jgi:hypothetical protein